jgi:DNA mismatch repair ATPase MutS
MTLLYKRLDKIRPLSYSMGEVKQLGYLRSLFYELRFCPKLRQSITYCVGVQHYAANIQRIQTLRKNKKLGMATFKAGPITFKRAYHPVLMNKDPVTNSYKVDKNLLITGPNASGKTTFVKTTLINIIFTQQIGMGFYKKASILPYQELLCYLNIPDTSGRDSLFQAEARRCKEIVDSIDLYPSRRTFCIFDELYSGTNPHEASASAYAFLKYLANKDCCTYLLTTHFIEVCDSLSSHKRIRNVHMHTTDKNECLQYHYSMQRGISKVRGGLQVLKDLEYPEEIITMATSYSKSV